MIVHLAWDVIVIALILTRIHILYRNPIWLLIVESCAYALQLVHNSFFVESTSSTLTKIASSNTTITTTILLVSILPQLTKHLYHNNTTPTAHSNNDVASENERYYLKTSLHYVLIKVVTFYFFTLHPQLLVAICLCGVGFILFSPYSPLHNAVHNIILPYLFASRIAPITTPTTTTRQNNNTPHPDDKPGIFDLSHVVINLDFRTNMWGNLGFWTNFDEIQENFSQNQQGRCISENNIANTDDSVGDNTEYMSKIPLFGTDLIEQQQQQTHNEQLAAHSYHHDGIYLQKTLLPAIDPQTQPYMRAAQRLALLMYYKAGLLSPTTLHSPITPLRLLDVGFGCGDQLYLLIKAMKYQHTKTNFFLQANQNNTTNNNNNGNNTTNNNTNNDQNAQISGLPPHHQLHHEIYGINLSHQQTDMAIERLKDHFPQATQITQNQQQNQQPDQLTSQYAAFVIPMTDSPSPTNPSTTTLGITLQQGSATELLPPDELTPIYLSASPNDHPAQLTTSTRLNPTRAVSSKDDNMALGFEKEMFSVVTCLDSIYHFEPKIQFLADVHKLLQPQVGRFVFTDVVLKPTTCEACNMLRGTYCVVSPTSPSPETVQCIHYCPTQRASVGILESLPCLKAYHPNTILHHISSAFSIPQHNLYTYQDYHNILSAIGYTNITIQRIDQHLYTQFFHFATHFPPSGLTKNPILAPLQMLKFYITGCALHYLAKGNLDYVIITADKK